MLSVFVDLKHLIEAERAESRARGDLHSSTSDSYYTDSYLEESKDEASLSSNGMKILWTINYSHVLKTLPFPTSVKTA